MIRTSPTMMAALAVAAAGLCGVLAWEFMTFLSIEGESAEPLSLQTTRSIGNGQSGFQADRWTRDILTRPVFSPDRRPVEVSGRQAGGLRLTGIIVSDLGRVAIFAKPTAARATVVEEGGEIDGSKVLEVTQTGVVLIGPSGRTVMTPVFDPAPRARTPLQVASPVPPSVSVKTEVRP